ncbi:cytochrome P450 [Nocardia sp. alder85J]|uniref:cytochrome P450 n=1 Tax=Nocardia sp. alder85J TaxID=2862949 RepID=UPI001CD4D3BF|nr:cytochrome P450 [Nocardia sp. alder85J]MCX4094146.1 cytochrome P450 [Nocardia sp. alder85J]
MTDALPAFPMARATGCPFDPPPQLRKAGPISRVRLWNGATPWQITGYDDLRAVLSDQRFSADSRHDGYPHQSASVRARQSTAYRAFIAMDDPEHARLRRMLTAELSAKRVEAMRPQLQRIVDDLIDDLLAGPNPVDLVPAFAFAVPSLTLCLLLGLPLADRDFFRTTSRKLLSWTTPVEEAMLISRELRAYLVEVIAAKQHSPTDDLIGRLAAGPLAAGAATVDEILDLIVQVLIAGHETTGNMIALGTLALLAHPGQLAELRTTTDPQTIATATDELLRYLSVVHDGRRRVATADIEIGGRLIRAGEGVVLLLEAGNRDHTVFPDPDRLDIHRRPHRHLAFGHGTHLCLGQPLARAELRTVYGTLYRRIPTLRLAIPLEELEFERETVVYGVRTLPVEW